MIKAVLFDLDDTLLVLNLTAFVGRYLHGLSGLVGLIADRPAVLLLPDAGMPLDEELCRYFVDKGYAVLMPDYSGKTATDKDSDFRTVYPPSLDYANYERARGLYDMENDLAADKTTWFEWLYVALFSVRFLKAREDIGNIGARFRAWRNSAIT